MVHILFTKTGPSSLNGTGPMKILRLGPLLAVAGAVCLGAAWLVAWTPHRHPPQPPPKTALSDADLAPHANVSEPAPGRAADLKSPLTLGVDPPSVPAPPVDSLPS